MQGKIYQFEDYLLDVSEQRLQKNGEAISLPPKVFEVLAVLVERHGQLVGYDELMKEVWQNTFVEETNLRYCVHFLRKVFDKELIETVPKRGYRLNAVVKSFSHEDFIQKYVGQKPPAVSRPPDSGRTRTFISKSAGLIGLAVLTAVIGFAVYYFSPHSGQAQKRQYLSSIAVLPFSVIGAQNGRETEIQKGLADSLNFNLGKIGDLKVIPATELQNYFGKEFEPLKVGKSLNVDEVLTGTYRLENNLVRVNVALLRVADGTTSWTKTFTVKEATQIESETAIALPIAHQLGLKTARLRDEERLRDQNIDDEIKKNYLTAREILRLSNYNRRREATELFEKIVAAEPDWALGRAGFAEALVLTHGGETSCQNAPNMAQKALQTDDSIVEAYLVLGLCHQYNYDWKNAEQAYQKAVQINPKHAKAYHDYALMLDLHRRFAEAEANFRKAVELDPFSPEIRASVCQHYYYDKNLGEALAQCFEARKIDPEFWMTPKKLHWVYVAQGRFDEVFKLHYGSLTEADIAKNQIAKALSEGNIQNYWKASIETRLSDPRKRFSPFAIAGFYAQLAEKEKALEFLEKEFEVESCKCNLPIANADPVFDTVRKEPRFGELMRKINLN
jgi:DNA-binding winged helix-turn-helix (wHTH) protein/TolB-like protein/Flp pilus assembly protein TadD